MRGDNHLLAVTTTQDEITGETKPLFAFPVQIAKATDEKEARFDIAAPSGGPRLQQYVDSITGEVVTDADCQRGVRVGDEFRAIDPEQITQITEATKLSTMVALGTVELDKIDFTRSTGTYYVQSPAKGGSPKAYRLVYEALREKRNTAGTLTRPAKGIVTKRTARSRQKLCVIYADTNRQCLMLQEVRFAATLREPDEQVLAPQLAQVDQAQVEKAQQIIDGLGDGKQVLDSEHDELLDLRAELIEQALAGDPLAIPTPIAATVASDSLESLLEASLAKQTELVS